MHNKPNTDLGKRQDRRIQERVHDPYKTPRKLAEPTLCPDCGAVFHDGRWQWITPAPANPHQTRCQACHRIRDGYPAGIITLRGAYVHEHRNEIVEMARNCEAIEKGAHPLHRIMAVEDADGAVLIKTTDIHLPHHIAEALRRSHHADPEIQYDQEGYFVRVAWRRES
jgi:hypothetical protein